MDVSWRGASQSPALLPQPAWVPTPARPDGPSDTVTSSPVSTGSSTPILSRPRVAPEVPPEGRATFEDLKKAIQSAIHTEDPAWANVNITEQHRNLSEALMDVVGRDAGPNFHSWAVWGSREAGVTIREEKMGWLKPAVFLSGALLGGLAGGLLPGLIIGLGATILAAGRIQKTANEMLQGNATVLEDIGTETARFVATFQDTRSPDPQRLADFLSHLGPSQGLLKSAFTHYYEAKFEPDRKKKTELMVLANCEAILHEHMRLQKHIEDAMPCGLRRFLTARVLGYRLDQDHYKVAQEITRPMPPELQTIDHPELQKFLAKWDDAGSKVENWAVLKDRMSYIADLFRAHHFDPAVLAHPYSAEQQASLAAGHIPKGL